MADQMNTDNMCDDIDVSKLKFVVRDEKIFDVPPKTEPVSAVKAAVKRYMRTKSAVVSLVIILLLVLYAIIWPFASQYKVSERNTYYKYVLPKLSTEFDLGFWNGCKTTNVVQQKYDYYDAIPGAIRKVKSSGEEQFADTVRKTYRISLDTYSAVGFVDLDLSKAEFDKLTEYENANNIQIMYPLIDTDRIECVTYRADSNAWYASDSKGRAYRTDDGQLQNIFLKSADPEVTEGVDFVSTFDGTLENISEGTYDSSNNLVKNGYIYAKAQRGGKQYQIRVLYSRYYEYAYGKKICYLFGGDEMGYDICVRLASGARVSLSISFATSILTLIIGIFIGSIEGYYGGKVDLFIEAFKSILSQIPTIVLITLFQMYIGSNMGSMFSLFFCLVLFGWMGISSTVRAQFYRFKGQEYVLAARTLGAKDKRLIFKHILPNASGFIVTSCILTIPGVIFSEATFSYLGIVNLNSDNLTSVGTMLENGHDALAYYPHCILLPALFLAILLICFNEIGNGLRDALDTKQ